MKLTIDFQEEEVSWNDGEALQSVPFHSAEAFEKINQAYLRVGWDNKYVYRFSWLGRPVIQLPDDLIRVQEVIFQVKPDYIIETGVAHGGSLIFYAGLLKLIGGKQVIGVDIEIRPHNRKEIEEHFLYPFISLVEGDSKEPTTVQVVKNIIPTHAKVMVILDSNHKYLHVLEELRAYSDLVNKNSYIVVADGILEDLEGAPRSQPGWSWDNPKAAIDEFLKENDDFSYEPPDIPFNEGNILQHTTYWKKGWLKRK